MREVLTGRIVLLSILLSLAANSRMAAQYFQFSQYNITPVRVNPANVAATDFSDVNIVYRNQSTAGNFSINSSAASFHRPFYFKRSKVRWGGFGITALDDRAGGSALLNNQSLGLSFGLNIPTAKKQSLSIGVTSLLYSTRYSLGDLTTGSQYVPGRGIVPTGDLNEYFEDLSKTTVRFNAGILWQEMDRYFKPKKYFGLSFADINQPDQSVIINNVYKVPAVIMAQAGIRLIDKKSFSASTELLYTGFAATHALNVGMVWRLKIMENRRSLDYRHLSIHTKYIVNNYGVVALQWEQPKYVIGASYDVSLGAVRVANAGAFEVSFILKKFIAPKKKRNNRAEVEKEKREKAKKQKAKKAKKKKKRKNKKRKGKNRKGNRERDKEIVAKNDREAEEKKSEKEILEEVVETKPKDPIVSTPPVEQAEIESSPKVPIENIEVPQKEIAVPETNIKAAEAATQAVESSAASEAVDVETKAGRLIYRPAEVDEGTIAYSFDFDKIEPSVSFKAYLNELAALMKQDAALRLEVIGHTDKLGSAAYNLKLSKQRAKAVADYLMSLGIEGSRLTTDGKGEAEPLSPTSSNDENRRVEVHIFKG